MPNPRKLLRVTLLVGAGLLSMVVSAIGIGAFLWGSTLIHPDPQGILFCLGPALSLPFFTIAIWSPKWHRLFMWLLAVSSFLGAYLAIEGVRSDGHFLLAKPTLDGFNSLRLPPVILSILIGILVEFSYQLKRREAE
jgi:hypothetical protein